MKEVHDYAAKLAKVEKSRESDTRASTAQGNNKSPEEEKRGSQNSARDLSKSSINASGLSAFSRPKTAIVSL
jgi:hypothetical protein